MNEEWVGFDLDGTLAIFTRWQGHQHIGAPIPEMIDRVKQLLNAGRKVKIFTARVSSIETPEDKALAETTIKAWTKVHIGQELEVTAEKDVYMIEFYDDRCVPVEYNTGRIGYEI